MGGFAPYRGGKEVLNGSTKLKSARASQAQQICINAVGRQRSSVRSAPEPRYFLLRESKAPRKRAGVGSLYELNPHVARVCPDDLTFALDLALKQ
jgi:hypothetical protein